MRKKTLVTLYLKKNRTRDSGTWRTRSATCFRQTQHSMLILILYCRQFLTSLKALPYCVKLIMFIHNLFHLNKNLQAYIIKYVYGTSGLLFASKFICVKMQQKSCPLYSLPSTVLKGLLDVRGVAGSNPRTAQQTLSEQKYLTRLSFVILCHSIGIYDPI